MRIRVLVAEEAGGDVLPLLGVRARAFKDYCHGLWPRSSVEYDSCSSVEALAQVSRATEDELLLGIVPADEARAPERAFVGFLSSDLSHGLVVNRTKLEVRGVRMAIMALCEAKTHTQEGGPMVRAY